MSKLTGFKKAAACTAAVIICASAFSGAGNGMINADPRSWLEFGASG
ncbi:hypothetical protein [Ruminococcus albus]|nr:hypothetical protein [Ruminococcus albus]